MAFLTPELDSYFQQIEARLRYVGQLSRSIHLQFDASTADYSQEQIATALAKAARKIEPFVRKIILRHYRESRLGTFTKGRSYVHTGWIVKAIRGIRVTLAARPAANLPGWKPSINITFPAGVNYEAMAALNYGAVHTPKATRPVMDIPTGKIKEYKTQAIVGPYAKRSLKKFAYTGNLSKRARTKIQMGSRFHGVQVTPGVQIHSTPKGVGKKIEVAGNVRVTRPFPFFYFTPMDVGALAAGFEKEFYAALG